MEGCNRGSLVPTSFNMIPECLEIAFSFLPVTEIAKARLVCKDWNQVGQSPLLLQKKIDQCQSETDPKKINDVILMLMCKRTSPQNDRLIIDLSARSQHLWIENFALREGLEGMRPVDYTVSGLASIHDLPDDLARFLGLSSWKEVKALSQSDNNLIKLIKGIEQFIYNYKSDEGDAIDPALKLLDEASAGGCPYAFCMSLFARSYLEQDIQLTELESLIKLAESEPLAQKLLLRILKSDFLNEKTAPFLQKLVAEGEIPRLVGKLAEAGELKFQVEHAKALMAQGKSEEATTWLFKAAQANYLPAIFELGRLYKQEKVSKEECLSWIAEKTLDESQLAFFLGMKAEEKDLPRKQIKLTEEYIRYTQSNESLTDRSYYYQVLSMLYKLDLIKDKEMSKKYLKLSEELYNLKNQFDQKVYPAQADRSDSDSDAYSVYDSDSIQTQEPDSENSSTSHSDYSDSDVES